MRHGNRLIMGDNTTELHKLERTCKSKVGLIYIDPPFSINRVFHVSRSRIATISTRGDSAVAYADTTTGKEYLDSLKAKLKLAHSLLSDDGSIYLHIDCKVAYQLKVILDDVFGPQNFRNSISRIKSNPKNFAQKGYGSVKDTILFYTKSDKHTWHEPRVSPDEECLARFSKEDYLARFSKEDAGGRYTTTPIHAPGETKNGDTGKRWNRLLPPAGRHWRYSRKRLTELNEEGKIEWSKTGNPRLKIYAKDAMERGILLQDVWEFKDPQYPSYPTEKNPQMLDAIVRASSDPGDTVLDFYCGSGTTLLAAAKNDRQFIGIDKSEHAIAACKKKLEGYKYGRK